MKSMLKIGAAICVIFAIAGCRGKAPIHDVDHQLLPESAKHMTNKQIADKMMAVVSKRGFYCNQVASNQLMCTKDARGHEAKIAIAFSQNDFSIRHMSTTNMKENNGRVHPKYNKWIAALKKDILKAFSSR